MARTRLRRLPTTTAKTSPPLQRSDKREQGRSPAPLREAGWSAVRRSDPSAVRWARAEPGSCWPGGQSDWHLARWTSSPPPHAIARPPHILTCITARLNSPAVPCLWPALSQALPSPPPPSADRRGPRQLATASPHLDLVVAVVFAFGLETRNPCPTPFPRRPLPSPTVSTQTRVAHVLSRAVLLFPSSPRCPRKRGLNSGVLKRPIASRHTPLPHSIRDPLVHARGHAHQALTNKKKVVTFVC
jgi:hypothetical protein